jgi:hypothetical protein
VAAILFITALVLGIFAWDFTRLVEGDGMEAAPPQTTPEVTGITRTRDNAAGPR